MGDGTTVTFTTPTYVLGNDSVLVYNDGVLMTKGALADYTETSVTSVTFNVPPASGAYLSFVVGTGSAVGSSGGSYWVKTTKTYTDFSTAALTNSISLGITLLPQQVLRGVVIKHSAAFSGPGITGYNVSLGLSGNNAKYASAFDVYQAASATTSQSSLDMFVENFSTFTTVTVTATSIGANLSAATAGIVDIWTLIDTLP